MNHCPAPPGSHGLATKPLACRRHQVQAHKPGITDRCQQRLGLAENPDQGIGKLNGLLPVRLMQPVITLQQPDISQ